MAPSLEYGAQLRATVYESAARGAEQALDGADREERMIFDKWRERGQL